MSLSEKEARVAGRIVGLAGEMSCDAQLEIATVIATNIGYELKVAPSAGPEPRRRSRACLRRINRALYGPLVEKTGARWCSWVKQFAAFKRNVPVAYAWEPVIIKAGRKPVVSKREVMRDWIMCPITMRKGLTGAKPEKVCHWAFELSAAHPEDAITDMFPGTGAVTEAWRTWKGKFTLPPFTLVAAE